MTNFFRNHPTFVKCIKPNINKSSMVFEDSVVMHQLLYSGLLEVVRVRKSGFSVRLDYDTFVKW